MQITEKIKLDFLYGADLLKNRRLFGCCCNLVKKMEFNVLDSQNLLTEVLFDPVREIHR